MRIFISALRGSVGFAIASMIAAGGFFVISAEPDNLSYHHSAAGEAAVVGEWRASRSRVRYARFEPDGTFAIAPSGREKWITGTYEMAGPHSARLDPDEPWATAQVELRDRPESPELVLTGPGGETTRLRWFRRSPPPARLSGGRDMMLLLLLPFLAGALGATILLLGREDCLRGALAFGVAAIPAALAILFTLISLQGGGQPDYGWLATGCGFGFALFGLIGGASLSARLALAGALSFGLAGAACCPAAVAAGGTPLSAAMPLMPFALGGAAFGAAVELLR